MALQLYIMNISHYVVSLSDEFTYIFVLQHTEKLARTYYHHFVTSAGSALPMQQKIYVRRYKK